MGEESWLHTEAQPGGRSRTTQSLAWSQPVRRLGKFISTETTCAIPNKRSLRIFSDHKRVSLRAPTTHRTMAMTHRQPAVCHDYLTCFNKCLPSFSDHLEVVNDFPFSKQWGDVTQLPIRAVALNYLAPRIFVYQLPFENCYRNVTIWPCRNSAFWNFWVTSCFEDFDLTYILKQIRFPKSQFLWSDSEGFVWRVDPANQPRGVTWHWPSLSPSTYQANMQKKTTCVWQCKLLWIKAIKLAWRLTDLLIALFII